MPARLPCLWLCHRETVWPSEELRGRRSKRPGSLFRSVLSVRGRLAGTRTAPPAPAGLTGADSAVPVPSGPGPGPARGFPDTHLLKFPSVSSFLAFAIGFLSRAGLIQHLPNISSLNPAGCQLGIQPHNTERLLATGQNVPACLPRGPEEEKLQLESTPRVSQSRLPA